MPLRNIWPFGSSDDNGSGGLAGTPESAEERERRRRRRSGPSPQAREHAQERRRAMQDAFGVLGVDTMQEAQAALEARTDEIQHRGTMMGTRLTQQVRGRQRAGQRAERAEAPRNIFDLAGVDPPDLSVRRGGEFRGIQDDTRESRSLVSTPTRRRS